MIGIGRKIVQWAAAQLMETITTKLCNMDIDPYP
jgi:hypothetical protein